MNNEPSKDKQRLLNDVLRGDSFDDFNLALKQQAIGTLRRARTMRRLAAASSVLIAACMIAVGLRFGPQKSADYANKQTSASPVAGKAVEITEQQLVEMFPPDSCFIAEVDGKKVLVFRDSQLREQYLN